MLSTARQLADSLQTFVKRPVHVEVWGVALPGSSDSVFEVESIFAIGAGLQIYLRSTPERPASQLKVAQPQRASVLDGRLEVGGAAYISWRGKNLPRAADKETPALTFVRLA